MAVVHRAESRKPDTLGRIVALKQLHSQNEFDVDFDVVRSFVDEARLATRFHHINIANTYSLGKIGRDYFIEMEYVPGPTLQQVAHQCEIAAGAIPVSVIVQILIQICNALEHVHTMCDNTGKPLKLVHRDVSLSNIIVSDGGIVKLIDFGIVKGHSSQASTQAGTIKGKLAYIAPEYLVGQLDSRADLYALGVIAHELLTERRLFHGANDLDTLTRIRDLHVPPPSRFRSEVPRALDAIVMKALERNPDERWQTAHEMRAALVELADHQASPHQVNTWTTWAFAQPPRPDSSQLLRVIDSLGQPTVIVDLDSQLLEAIAVVEPPRGQPPRSPARVNLMLVASLVVMVGLAVTLLILAGLY
jgi:serine/threonine protein kinase